MGFEELLGGAVQDMGTTMGEAMLRAALPTKTATAADTGAEAVPMESLPAQPYSLSWYLDQARKTVSDQEDYPFERLPNVIAEWILVEYRTTADLIELEKTIDDYYDTLYLQLETAGAFKEAKVTNAEGRKSFTNQQLINDHAYRELTARKIELKQLQGLSRANVKRYQRSFEVQQSRLGFDLSRQHLEGVAAIVASLKIKP